MDIKAFLLDWIAVSNSYDTEKYLEKYLADAVLDDPSVGRKFAGHKGIRNYYESYFIGYKTQTKFMKAVIGDNQAHLEVEFTGDFPEGKIGGMFDLTFRDEKIATVKADLM
ncbi:MAG: nuclear transport factor 2 family protein [Bacteroidota bacterium]